MSKGSIVRRVMNLYGKNAALRLAQKLNIIDGGPGSGNWGHHGRPGKVGGSGKGGGKQYRGGRSDVGYFGSRKDWMNGLTGGDQYQAARFVAAKKRELSEKANYKKKLIGLSEKGILTQSEVEERLKKDRLQDLDENMTPEDYIMKCGSIEDREELLNHVAGGRKWNEHADRFIKENWDENDKKLVMALADKYGRAFVGGAELPDESEADEWDEEDRRTWYDLKSKALEGPASGKEAPDELQYAAGLKERPKPKLVGIPKSAEENETWFDSADEYKQRAIRMDLQKFGLSPENFAGLIDMNEAESRMESKVIQSFGSKESIKDWASYLRTKEMALGVDAHKLLATGATDNLSEEQKKAARDLLEIGMGYDENHNPLEKVSDIAEYGLLSNSEVPETLKAYYLSLKARALGYGLDKKPEDSLMEQAYGKHIRETDLIPLVKKRLTSESHRAAATPEKYRERRKNNAVVIQGDKFSEKIHSMRKESGDYSAEEYKTVGEEVSKEVETKFDEITKRVERLDEEAKLKQEAYHDLCNLKNAVEAAGFTQVGEFMDSTAYQEYRDKRDNAWREYQDTNRKLLEASDEYGQVVSDALRRVRKCGVKDKQALKLHLPGRSIIKKYVQEAYERYPSEWCEQSFLCGIVQLKKVSRGYCGDDIIAVSGEGKSAQKTATHELGHRFERTVPGIVEAERAFYESRTSGEQLKSLRSVTGNRGYKSREITKVDNFLDPYMGKDYNGRAYELVSMGFEMAFHRPQELMKDRDYANFIFGILAVG